MWVGTGHPMSQEGALQLETRSLNKSDIAGLRHFTRLQEDEVHRGCLRLTRMIMMSERGTSFPSKVIASL